MSVMGCFSSAAETARSWDSEKKIGKRATNRTGEHAKKREGRRLGNTSVIRSVRRVRARDDAREVEKHP